MIKSEDSNELKGVEAITVEIGRLTGPVFGSSVRSK